MSIWFKRPELDELNRFAEGSIISHIGIAVTDFGDDFIAGTMPADERTFQPFKVVHGGANIVLAETLGSIGGMLTLDPEKYYCVGQEVNANHLRAVRSGSVCGRAQQIYAGQRSQVWETKIYDDKQKLTCISRLTLAVLTVA